MKFGEALNALKLGKAVKRIAWDAGTQVVLDGEIGLWSSKDHPQQVYHPDWKDLMGDDWVVVEIEE